MNLPIATMIAVTLGALTLGTQATAAAETTTSVNKIATVNLQQLYATYYMRAEAEKRIADLKTEVQGEVNERAEKLKALAAELTALKNQNDPSLSEAARKKLQEEFTAKATEAQAAEQELKSFASRREAVLKDNQRREIVLLLQAIQAVIDATAEADSYDLVIDSSAATATGTRVFPYTKATYDITPALMKALNKDAPAGYDPEEVLKSLTAPAAAAE